MFVQDCGDLFSNAVPSKWIDQVLIHCRKYPGNTYLFQSKNPARFIEFSGRFPEKRILGTTLETNRQNHLSQAPDINDRAHYIRVMKGRGFKVMVSIEPILDFDHHQFVQIIKNICPAFVSIGADSKRSALTEPSPMKLEMLIKELQEFVEIRLKSNLTRLLG